jgi:hypothetical protein
MGLGLNGVCAYMCCAVLKWVTGAIRLHTFDSFDTHHLHRNLAQQSWETISDFLSFVGCLSLSLSLSLSVFLSPPALCGNVRKDVRACVVVVGSFKGFDLAPVEIGHIGPPSVPLYHTHTTTRPNHLDSSLHTTTYNYISSSTYYPLLLLIKLQSSTLLCLFLLPLLHYYRDGYYNTHLVLPPPATNVATTNHTHHPPSATIHQCQHDL